MASPVIFKLRVISPRSQDAPIRNKSHVFYIGKRRGTVINDCMSHGLFGKMLGKEFGNIENIKEVADYIYDKTKENTNMYRGIISLKEEEALRLNYDKKETWEELIKGNIFEIADKIGIPSSRVEYCGAVHMEKRHPHTHFILWDKEQKVKEPFIHSSIANKIRVDLTKKIYADELREFYQLKNEARDILSSNSSDFFKDFFEPFAHMDKEEYKKTIEKLRKNPDNALGHLIDNRIAPFVLEDFALKILEFKEKLPKTGRLNYKFLLPELKSELEDIVLDLVSNNEHFLREFEKYGNISKTIASHYSTDEIILEKAKQKAETELLKRLSNRLLKSIKEINYSHKRIEGIQKNKAFRKTIAIKIITELFSFLTRTNEAEQRKCESKRVELSKQAKKELAIKKEHASYIDWER